MHRYRSSMRPLNGPCDLLRRSHLMVDPLDFELLTRFYAVASFHKNQDGIADCMYCSTPTALDHILTP